jgi:hypothetical protein
MRCYVTWKSTAARIRLQGALVSRRSDSFMKCARHNPAVGRYNAAPSPVASGDPPMPVSSTSLRLLILPGMAVAALSGCATTNPCGDDPEYLAAQERPRLQLPKGVTGSERLSGGMIIPPVAPDPAKLDPAPKCLDQPPPYFGPKAVMAGSVEEAVYVWASAWANRKPDQVAAFYSPQFQAAEDGGAAAYIEDRKQQVANGAAPDARLEELKTRDAGPDGKVVTFVQRFGKDAYVKELTLARDAQGWRIVAERTLQKL